MAFFVYSVLGSKKASKVDTLAQRCQWPTRKDEHNLQSAELGIAAHRVRSYDLFVFHRNVYSRRRAVTLFRGPHVASRGAAALLQESVATSCLRQEVATAYLFMPCFIYAQMAYSPLESGSRVSLIGEQEWQWCQAGCA